MPLLNLLMRRCLNTSDNHGGGLSREPCRLVVEEKIQSGRKRYDYVTIGSAPIKVTLRSTFRGVEVVCDAFNAYSSYDPSYAPELSGSGEHLSYGSTFALMEIEAQVKAFRRAIEKKVKL